MSGGTIPSIRYLDSYDHFTYDAVTISKMFDFVLIRGQKGIVNARTADLIVEGGSIFKQGLKLAQAKIGGTDLVHIGPSDWAADKKYAREFAGTLSYNVNGGPSDEDQLLVINKHGYTIDLLHSSDSGTFEGPINMSGYCIYNVGCIEMNTLPPPSNIGPSDLDSDIGRIVNLRGPINPMDAVNKQYVDFLASDVENTYVKKIGDTMTGPLIMDYTNISINSGNFETTDTIFISNNDTYDITNANYKFSTDTFDVQDTTIKVRNTIFTSNSDTHTIANGTYAIADSNYTIANGTYAIADSNYTIANGTYTTTSTTFTFKESTVDYGSLSTGESSDGTIVKNLRYPQDLADSANKQYVDTQVATISGGLGAGLQVGVIMMWPLNEHPKKEVTVENANTGAIAGSYYWLPCDGSTNLYSTSDYPALSEILPISNGYYQMPQLNNRMPIGHDSYPVAGPDVLTTGGPSTGIPSSVVTASDQSIKITRDNLPSEQIDVNITGSIDVTTDTSTLSVHIVEKPIIGSATITGSSTVVLQNQEHTHKVRINSEQGGAAANHNSVESYGSGTHVETGPPLNGGTWEPYISVSDIATNLHVHTSELKSDSQSNVQVNGTATNTVDTAGALWKTDPLGSGSDLAITGKTTDFSAQIPVIVMNFIIFASALPTTTP
jgi:hypothetical protein